MSYKKRIFILEQSRIVGLDLKRHLTSRGYVVCEENDFTGLKHIMEQNAPDLIISDASIQQQAEFQVVKNHFLQKQIPIICIGTETDEQATKDCEGINIIGVFSKPFETSNVIELIDKYLSIR